MTTYNSSRSLVWRSTVTDRVASGYGMFGLTVGGSAEAVYNRNRRKR